MNLQKSLPTYSINIYIYIYIHARARACTHTHTYICAYYQLQLGLWPVAMIHKQRTIRKQ
jgi:hypothetical protein